MSRTHAELDEDVLHKAKHTAMTEVGKETEHMWSYFTDIETTSEARGKEGLHECLRDFLERHRLQETIEPIVPRMLFLRSFVAFS